MRDATINGSFQDGLLQHRNTSGETCGFANAFSVSPPIGIALETVAVLKICVCLCVLCARARSGRIRKRNGERYVTRLETCIYTVTRKIMFSQVFAEKTNGNGIIYYIDNFQYS